MPSTLTRKEGLTQRHRAAEGATSLCGSVSLCAILCVLAAGLAFPGWIQSARAADEILTEAQYPEGALWHRGKLYYAEMARDAVVVSDLAKAKDFWAMDECGPTSIAPYRDDELLVLCHLAHQVVRVSRDGRTLEVIDKDSGGKPFVYPNAACADANGGVYFSSSGTFALDAPATGAVLYLDRAGKLTRVAEGIRYANGVAVDEAEKRVLVSAHLARKVLAFPLLAPGKFGKPDVFFDLNARAKTRRHDYPLAGPDGLEIDVGGDVIVAEYGEGRVHEVGRDGAYLGTQNGFQKFVTDTALLPGGRAAVTASRINDAAPFPGRVVVRDRFLQRFKK